VDEGTWLERFAFGSLRLGNGGPDQLPDTGRFEIRGVCDADVANPFAFTVQQALRIGERRPEVKTEVDPIGMRRGEHEGIADAAGEREVIGDGVDLVDELAGLRSLYEDQLARGQRELPDGGAVRREEFAVLGIRGAQAHAASVPRRDPGGSGIARRRWAGVPAPGVCQTCDYSNILN
jgi:hypothetical protein